MIRIDFKVVSFDRPGYDEPDEPSYCVTLNGDHGIELERIIPANYRRTPVALMLLVLGVMALVVSLEATLVVFAVSVLFVVVESIIKRRYSVDAKIDKAKRSLVSEYKSRKKELIEQQKTASKHTGSTYVPDTYVSSRRRDP